MSDIPTDVTVPRDDPHHAGFDLVVAIAGVALKDLVQALFNNEEIPARFTGSREYGTFSPNTPLHAEFDLGLAMPDIRLEANPDNKFRLDLSLYGHLKLSPVVDGQITEPTVDHDLVYQFSIEVPLVFLGTSRAEGVRINLALSQAAQTGSVTLRAYETGTDQRSSDTESTLNILMPIAVGSILAEDFEDYEFALPIGDIGDVSINPDMQVSILIGDDLLFLAADGLSKADPPPPPGDPAALHDFTYGKSMAAVVHPRLIEESIQAIVDRVKADLRHSYDNLLLNEDNELINDITLNWLNFSLKQFYVQFHGKATKHNIDVTAVKRTGQGVRIEYDDWVDIEVEFWFKVVTYLNQYRDEIVTELGDVDIETPWWATFLGVVLSILILPVGIFTFPVVESLISSAEDRLAIDMNKSLGASRQSGKFEVAIAPGVKMTSIVKEVRIGKHGAEFWYRWSLPWYNMYFWREWIKPEVDESMDFDFKVGFPKGMVNPNDPELVLVWEYIRSQADPGKPGVASHVTIESGEAALWQELDANRELSFRFNIAPGAISYGFRGTLVRRSPEGETVIDEMYPGFYIEDRLDKRYPYVYWEHEVWRKNRLMGANDRTIALDNWKIKRRSRIHRTDWPGRCRFADQFSDDETLEMFYLTKLPIDPKLLGRKSQREDMRKLVCDYCFYGGPDKDRPLI